MDYKLHTIEYIQFHQQSIIEQCKYVKTKIDEDLTKTYYKYNMFSLTAGSVYFHEIYRQFKQIILDELPSEKLWFQAWLNYHKNSEVLDWHDHVWEYHGYISIDPKDTTTVFDNYEIKNVVGQLYFGPGYRKHKVKVNTPYSDYRITIGFDVTKDPFMDHQCFGLFPLI